MILFFYTLREYFRFVFGTTLIGVFLFILFDFMHKTTKYFSVYNPKTPDIILYYIYQIPFQVVQTLPIAALLASVITMVLLSRSNEVTVMRAVGLGPKFIVAPLAVGGMLLSIFSFFVNQFVIPPAATKMRYIQKVQIEGKSDSEIATGSRWVREKNRLFNFEDYRPLKFELTKIRLIELNTLFQVERVITAQNALYNRSQGNWDLNGVNIFDYAKDGMLIGLKKQKEMISFLPVEPKKLRKERRIPEEMAIGELKDLIRKGEETGRDVLSEKISLEVKWAYPFASFFVSLLGLKFGFTSERKTESVRSILIAFLIGISYWFIFSAARALGARGDISPFLAAWVANIVMLAIASFQIWKVRRS